MCGQVPTVTGAAPFKAAEEAVRFAGLVKRGNR
jgi:hypothetical protein